MFCDYRVPLSRLGSVIVGTSVRAGESSCVGSPDFPTPGEEKGRGGGQWSCTLYTVHCTLYTAKMVQSNLSEVLNPTPWAVVSGYF